MKQFVISIISSISLLLLVFIGIFFYYDIDIKNLISITTTKNDIQTHNFNDPIITDNKIDGNVITNSNTGDIFYSRGDITINRPLEDDINISINYMRMFDASKVPVWMLSLDKKIIGGIHIDQSTNEKINEIIKNNPQFLNTPIWKSQLFRPELIELLNKNNVKESDVGFLFLVLQNNTNHTFSEIEFIYYEIKNTNPKKATRENLKALVQKEESRRAAILRSGESFIWLLNVYKADKNGLPEFYLSDIQIPKSINYRCNKKLFSQNIREPYREKAIRVALPPVWIYQEEMSGWSGQ